MDEDFFKNGGSPKTMNVSINMQDQWFFMMWKFCFFSDILTEDTNKYGSISIEQVTLWLFNIAMENGP